MKYNPSVHHRHSIRLKEYDYSQNGAYFITICTQNRECLFGEIINNKLQLNDTGKMINQWWSELTNKFPNVKLDEYIIMPNHLHGIIQIVRAGYSRPEHGYSRPESRHELGQIIAFFKYQSTKSINELLDAKTLDISLGAKTLGAKTAPLRIIRIPYPKIWQRNYYEHIIRNEQSLEEIREYIANNPLNWENDRNNPKQKT